ncbi:MAG TPA: LuxR C-terminal-related transcriptional regulator [Saprospiraceae bacterium]|nr:LuxR C-terminal-related transcriptional regulator [Saprospiraceae bacterium]
MRKRKFSIDQLTENEHNTLVFICSGLTSGQIGKKMLYSKRTVEGFRNSLLYKTKARNVAELVAIAFRNKLVK